MYLLLYFTVRNILKHKSNLSNTFLRDYYPMDMSYEIDKKKERDRNIKYLSYITPLIKGFLCNLVVFINFSNLKVYVFYFFNHGLA